MRKKNSGDTSQPIGQAIRELLNTYRLDSKFDETNLVTSWERMVGKPISKRTKKVSLRNNVLYVEFDSPSMKQDFMLNKNEVLTLFHREFGADIIKDIVIL
jgi:predicted nucleic acid-binding Zn ribbon protein